MWEERYSESRGRKYYYNRETKESKWERPASYKGLHILFKHSESRRPSSQRTPVIVLSKEAARAEAKQTFEKLKESRETRKDFEEVARERSDCSSASRGGDLGEWIEGTMHPDFESAIKDTPLDSMHEGIVETPSGFHIIYRY